MEISCEPNTTKQLCASSLNLADMLTMVNPIDFGGHSSKVNVTMGIIDKCGVRGDATLCVVIFSGLFLYHHTHDIQYEVFLQFA